MHSVLSRQELGAVAGGAKRCRGPSCALSPFTARRARSLGMGQADVRQGNISRDVFRSIVYHHQRGSVPSVAAVRTSSKPKPLFRDGTLEFGSWLLAGVLHSFACATPAASARRLSRLSMCRSICPYHLLTNCRYIKVYILFSIRCMYISISHLGVGYVSFLLFLITF